MSGVLRGRTMDMTTGPLFRKILVFALPLVLTNLLQMLYNVADMIVVGRFSAVDGAVGAIGCTIAFINLINNFIGGLASGTAVVMSKAIGARDREATRNGVHTALMMGGILGVSCLFLGQVLCRPMLTWMDTSPQYFTMSEVYCRICFGGLPFSAVLSCVMGVMRASGDSTRPMIILTTSGSVNVLLNILFVAGLGMDVAGVAIATMISNIASMVAAVICLARDRGMCRLRFRRLRIHRHTAGQILSIGLPTGLQGVLFNASTMMVQAAVNSFGPATITATSIAANLENFVYVSGNAVAYSAMTFTGQIMGARKYQRLMPMLLNSFLAAWLLAGVMSVLVFVLREPLAGLYMNDVTQNREEIFAVVDINNPHKLGYWCISFRVSVACR